jgi:hypothetical protein
MTQPTHRNGGDPGQIESCKSFRRLAHLIIVVAILLLAGMRTGAVAAEQEAAAVATEATATDGEPAAEVTPEVETAVPTDSAPEPVITPTPEPTETAIIDDSSDSNGEGQAVDPDSPIEPIAPVVNLRASTSCTDLGVPIGTLIVETDTSSATITDIRAVRTQDSALLPVVLDQQLPQVLEPGTVSWSWHVEETTGAETDAMMVRIAELPGTDDANALAGDNQVGWLLVQTAGSTECPVPTPIGTAIEPTPEATTILTPSSPMVTPDTTATHTATVEPESDPIVVEAMDETLDAIPGETVDQHFQIRNISDQAITVEVTATTSSATWGVDLFAVDGVSPMTEPIVIEAYGSHKVIVRISIPFDAYAGDRSSIGLDVQPVHATS